MEEKKEEKPSKTDSTAGNPTDNKEKDTPSDWPSVDTSSDSVLFRMLTSEDISKLISNLDE